MKILKIRLHPFAGSPDFSRGLVDGLNIIDGPNEYGKSTLNNALWHALFTPANLTPAKLRDTMGRWFPKPTGDHARVTLEFEADGQTWTLEKCWGAGASSRLCASKSPPIADPGSVQKRLMELLRLNEATWRHVLFINQAQLNRTISELQEHGKNIDDLQPLLAGASAVPGDIAPEKLLQAFRDRIEDHFSKWDRNSNCPEGGKGIDNRWKRNVGPLLEAYYAMEEARRNEKNVLDYELELDGLNKKISDIKSRIEVDREFVEDGGKRSDGLLARTGQEYRIKLLEGELSDLKSVITEWPGAGNILQGKEGELRRVKQAILNLKEELKNAGLRAEAEQTRLAYGRLERAKAEWKDEEKKLTEMKKVPAEQLAELKRSDNEIQELRIQLEANKLITRIEGLASASIRIIRGNEVPETLTLSSTSEWEGHADGKLIVETSDLKLSVVSGTGDVNSLFENLANAKELQKRTLEKIGCENLADAEAVEENYKKCVEAVKHKKVAYEASLQGLTEEGWSQKLVELEAIPETRSQDVINNEMKGSMRRQARLEVEIDNWTNKINEWVGKFKDHGTVTDKYLGKTAELNKSKSDLSALPPLPEGFESIAEYLAEFHKKKADQEKFKKELIEQNTQKARLEGGAPSQSADELSDQLKTRERAFERLQAIGQSLLRICAKLEQIVAERGNDDPMKGLNIAIAKHFQQMTMGKYQGVRLEGTAPVEVSSHITIGAEQLSQGTLGSLALATRIALADFYLSEMPGFLILDDPFTDMDPSRRLAASKCLKNFSDKRQVILFTCHPEHLNDLRK
jgi:DNA repair protein SbcC/Rad50